MSYVLHIWHQPADAPVPKTVVDVDLIVTTLLRQTPTQPDERFVPLAQRLTQRYPCITTLDEESEDAVWTDGPLDGHTDRAVYVIGVQTAHLDAVVPFVIETARALGLNVYDIQAAEGHLADGTLLHLPDRAPVQWEVNAEDDGIETESLAMRLMSDRLKPFLEASGFKFKKSTRQFVRQKGGIRQELFIGATSFEPTENGWTHHYWISSGLLFREGLDLLTTMRPLEAGQEPWDSVELRCHWGVINKDLATASSTSNHTDMYFYIERRSEVPAVSREIEHYLAQRVLPFIDQCDSVGAIYARANLIDHPDMPIVSQLNPDALGPLLLAYMLDKDRFEQHVLAAVEAPNWYGDLTTALPIRRVLERLPDGERWVKVLEGAS